jgi:hypothetical protein
MFGWFKTKPSLELDLRKDHAAILSHFAAKVKQCSQLEELKDRRPVTRIDIRFDLTSEAYPRIWVELDDQPGGDPHAGNSQAILITEGVFKHWARPCHAVLERKAVKVITPSGAKVVDSETSLCEAVGGFLVEIMKSLRKGGIFKAVPRAANCYLGVQTNDGEFGWPHYDDRGRPEYMV